MSELITHTAIYEDCARLVQISPAMTGEFKLALERHTEIGAPGCLTRGGDKYPVHDAAVLRDLSSKGAGYARALAEAADSLRAMPKL